MKNFTQEQSHRMMLALIDLTQSEDKTIARRARSGLFEAEVLSGSDVDSDGGVMESRRLWEEQLKLSRQFLTLSKTDALKKLCQSQG